MHKKLKDYLCKNYKHKTKSMHLAKSEFVVAKGHHILLERVAKYNCANCDKKFDKNPIIHWQQKAKVWVGTCACRKKFKDTDI